MKQQKNIYVHIMPEKSPIHNGTIIHMINDNPNEFNKEQHTFIVANTAVYNEYSNYENVILEPDVVKNMNIFKKYAFSANYVFLHGNTLSAMKLAKLNNKMLNKIIWCVWGHDLYKINIEVKGIIRKAKRFFSIPIKMIREEYKKAKIKQFYAIGIGFQYDAIEIINKYGSSIKILTTPYGYKKGNKENIDSLISKYQLDNNKPYKVMVGHCAYEFLNHINIIKKLEKFKDENIIISLVLSYGNPKYKERVKNYAKELFGDKVEIIENKMSQEEYCSYLLTVDACILDYKHQAALGNIYLLLYMGKKLFLNENGIIKLFTILENIKTYNINRIEKMNFEEFKEPIENITNSVDFAKFHIDEKNYIEMWKNTINELPEKGAR